MDRVVTFVKWKEMTSDRLAGFFISNNGMVRKGKKGFYPFGIQHRHYYVVIFHGYKERGVVKRVVFHKYIHELVWEYFGDGRQNGNGWELHHKDLNPLNNHIDNLELLPIEKHWEIHNRTPKLLPIQS